MDSNDDIDVDFDGEFDGDFDGDFDDDFDDERECKEGEALVVCISRSSYIGAINLLYNTFQKYGCDSFCRNNLLDWYNANASEIVKFPTSKM